MSVIKASHVTKSYKVKKDTISALDDVDIAIESGEFLGIVGPSGSGKSTLLQILGGLDVSSTGEVLIDGRDITKLNDRQLAKLRSRTFGFVFQSFYLQPFLSVRQNIELPAVFTDESTKSRRSRTEELAKFLDIEDRLDHRPSELSGGQIQRVALLRAIYNKPSIVFADEPTGNLDSQNASAVFELLGKINSELGTTIVVATHDNLIAKYASRVIKLKHGHIV